MKNTFPIESWVAISLIKVATVSICLYSGVLMLLVMVLVGAAIHMNNNTNNKQGEVF